MTMMLDINPEVQTVLDHQAAIQGRAIEDYVAGLLEDAAHLPAADQLRNARPRKNLREVFDAVRGLADDLDFSRNPSTDRLLDLS